MHAPGMIRSALNGYRGLGALGAGAIAACGFQPLGLWPLTLLAVACWLELIARAPDAKRAALAGWLFGFGHFTVGNYWIATAFTYQAEMPHWLGSIAVALLSIYLAVFPALAALAAWSLARRMTAGKGAMMPLRGVGATMVGCWIVTEWLRAWVFTGFAWNPLGIALLGGYETQGLAATAGWIGTYGLSGLLVLIAAAARWLVRCAVTHSMQARIAAGIALVGGSAGLIGLMTLPAGYLSHRQGSVPYTLIQPDLRQEELNDPQLYELHFQRMARLTSENAQRGEQRVVFWPESGLPDYLRDGYPDRYYRQMTYAADPLVARERIGRVIGPYSVLLTGAVDLVVDDDRAVAARNSVTAIDWRGRVLAGYSKAHLVPYGEYLPMRALLEPIGLSRLVAGSLDFRPGPGPRTLDLGIWGEAGIQICYEIVFSGEVVDPRNRPDYIFNPSNDGWFGSWGPPQHLAQARLRAVEEGLPVLRATTTGISAVIDADGIVRAFVPRHRTGTLQGMIPPAHRPTLFARYGNALPLALALLAIMVSPVAMRRGKE